MKDRTRNERSKRRRDRLRAAGICINGWKHGPIFKGSRCFKCWRVHKGPDANMEPWVKKVRVPPPPPPQLSERQQLLKRMGKCINGPVFGAVGRAGVSHGPVVDGLLCQHCVDIANGVAKLKRDTRAREFRRLNGLCRNAPITAAGKPHGPLFKAGQCERCWLARMAADERREDERRAA